MNTILCPGELVLVTGYYTLLSPRGGKPQKTILLLAGAEAPPVPRRDLRWVLVRNVI